MRWAAPGVTLPERPLAPEPPFPESASFPQSRPVLLQSRPWNPALPRPVRGPRQHRESIGRANFFQTRSDPRGSGSPPGPLANELRLPSRGNPSRAALFSHEWLKAVQRSEGFIRLYFLTEFLCFVFCFFRGAGLALSLSFPGVFFSFSPIFFPENFSQSQNGSDLDQETCIDPSPRSARRTRAAIGQRSTRPTIGWWRSGEPSRSAIVSPFSVLNRVCSASKSCC